ncbi:MAG: outer membrane porin, OprD family [Saprospiraceae bacterium]|nr:outer membrane porin, OprD family [Saprospiraceae bacterium]
MYYRNSLRSLVLCLSVCIGNTLLAQHQDLQDKPRIWQDGRLKEVDSTSLLTAFKEGQVNGHFRYFFSATDNTDNLTDYYAHAAGGGLRFETAEFHRFRFAVSGFYIFNLASSDFTVKDPISGAANRYELGLFDIANPAFRDEISRLEELQLKYRLGKRNILTFGKQLINTPFINLQDGRMRPTQVEGLWTEWNDIKNLEIYLGWFYKIAPRGTSKWYSVQESIGVFPTGINPDGSRSGYRGNVVSKGVGLAGLRYYLNKQWNVQLWHLMTENVFSSTLLQSDALIGEKGSWQIMAGMQSVFQSKLGNGGNEDINKAFYNNEGNAMTYGARLGLKKNIHEITLNYNRITADGRYLMPREWGRDPFYTFLPRERNEGFGDVHAIALQYRLLTKDKHWNIHLAGGYYEMPDVKNTRLNKYGLPSYTQLNVDVRYKFGGFFEGMEAQLLIVRKIRNGETYDNYAYIDNKVDMTLINTVVNYRF